MNGRRRWVVGCASVIALGALGLGCDGKQGAGPDPAKPGNHAATEWKVGAYLSLSGEDAAFGIYTKEGIELAVDEINKAGGVKGKPIKVLYEDDKSNPQEATNKVLQLIDRDKVVALLGEVASARSKAGGIIANKKKVPMITPSSTNPDVTKVGPFVFRVCFTDDIQAQSGAEFIVSKLGKKRVGLLFASDDLYSSGLAEDFRKELKKRGGELVSEKGFLKKETNFTTYLNEIKDNKPDIIYAPIYYNQMTLIARQGKAAGIKGDQFLGGDGWDANEILNDAGEELEGAYFTNFYAPDVPWPNSQAFREAYTTRFKHDPSSLAAMGYDAAKVLADAIKRAKDDAPDSIRQAIQETKDFAGATGNITIDGARNADKPVVVVQIKGKKFTYFSTVHDKPGSASPAPEKK
ncbi:Branched-chain amino acid ABC transporter, amino acid-binding protein [Minicystis rosea]|nr:Branched-chain amino acid ABC transporter, amino acid-binding protein [Minicystis rosea]